MNATLLWPSDLPTLIISLAEKPTTKTNRVTDRQSDTQTDRVMYRWIDRKENTKRFPCKTENIQATIELTHILKTSK